MHCWTVLKFSKPLRFSIGSRRIRYGIVEVAGWCIIVLVIKAKKNSAWRQIEEARVCSALIATFLLKAKVMDEIEKKEAVYEFKIDWQWISLHFRHYDCSTLRVKYVRVKWSVARSALYSNAFARGQHGASETSLALVSRGHSLEIFVRIDRWTCHCDVQPKAHTHQLITLIQITFIIHHSLATLITHLFHKSFSPKTDRASIRQVDFHNFAASRDPQCTSVSHPPY